MKCWKAFLLCKRYLEEFVKVFLMKTDRWAQLLVCGQHFLALMNGSTALCNKMSEAAFFALLRFSWYSLKISVGCEFYAETWLILPSEALSVTHQRVKKKSKKKSKFGLRRQLARKMYKFMFSCFSIGTAMAANKIKRELG